MQTELAKTLMERVDADIRELRADVRDLRAEHREHTELVDRRLDSIERGINGNHNSGPWWARYWKELVIIALIGQAFGLNIAESLGLIG